MPVIFFGKNPQQKTALQINPAAVQQLLNF